MDMMNYSPMRIHQWGHSLVRNWKYRESEISTSFWRAWVNDREGAYLFCDGRRIAMKPHVIYLIAPETNFSTDAATEFRQLYIHFTMKFPGHEPHDNIFEVPVWPEVDRLMAAWEKQFVRDSVQTFLSIAGLLHTAVSKLPEKCFVRVKAP